MKKTLLCVLIFHTIIFNAQTTYTYSGSGNWNETANWSPSYPGTALAHLDEAIIPSGSNVTISSTTTIYGKLTLNGSIESTAFFNIVGELVANGSFTNKSLFTNFGTSTFNASITSSSSFRNEGSLFIKSTFNNSSTFITDNGGITENESVINNNSTFKVEFGGSFKNTGTINSTGTITNNGTFNNENSINCNTFINNNSIINDIGSISFYNNVYYLMGSNISHTGNNSISNRLAPRTSVDNDYNPISPVNPIGEYSFDDNITLESSARIEIDLKTDALHDLISIGDTAVLNGILQVNLLESYNPPIGTKIIILQTINGISGTFNNAILPDLVTIPDIGTEKEFKINYNSNNVELEVVASEALSVNNFSKNKLEIYPNPVQKDFYINGLSQNERLVITSLLGKTVSTSIVSPNENKVNVDHLKPGIYILNIGNISHTRILKK